MSDPTPASDRHPPSASGGLILALLCGAATVAYVQRQCLGTVEKPIREELGLSFAEMGSVQASFFLTYAMLQIPAGWGAQRWGIRKSLLAMAIVWSLACALIPLVRGTSDLVTLRLLMGAAQAGIFTCTTLAVRRFFIPTRYGLANGVIAGSMQVGGFLGAVLAGWVTGLLGWRGMFLFFALPGFVWAALFWNWFPRESPEASRERDSAPITAATWWSLACAWPLWCLSCQQFLRAGAQMFFGSWFATYLQEARGLDLTQAGFLNGIPIAVASLGPLAGGWAADRLLAWSGSRRVSRQCLASGCLLLCALLMFLGYRATHPEGAVALIGAGAFFAAAAGPAAYTSTMDLGGTRLALVFAVMNMWGNVGAAAFPKLIGQMLGAASQRAGGTSEAWDDVFAVFITLYVLAALAWLPFHIRRPIEFAEPVPPGSSVDRSVSGRPEVD
ncbi:MAG: MFS transporter [Planctomycetaceae bacterium]|jgi:MFS family permease